MITQDHPEWPAMKRAIEAEIARCHTELEIPSPAETTAALRGEIAAYRRIVGLVERGGIEAPARSYT